MRNATVLTLVSALLIAVSAGPLAESGQTARGRGVAGPPVAPEILEALLPVLKGWQKGDPSSETISIAIVMSVARVSYEKGDLSLSLEITDTLANPMLTGPFQTMVSAAGPGGKTVEGVTAKTFSVKASQNEAKDTSAAREAVEAVNVKALADRK